MKYLFDTDFCVEHMRARLSEAWRDRLKVAVTGDLNISMVTVSELFFGAYRSAKPSEAIKDVRLFCPRFQILALDMRAAEIYGEIRASLAKSGTPIGPNDLFIAAIALANNSRSSTATSPNSAASPICKF